MKICILHFQHSHKKSFLQLVSLFFPFAIAAAMCPSGSSQPVLLQVTRATSEEFQSAFDILDADHDGKISHHDLQSFYNDYSSIKDQASDIIGTMMSVADSNNDGFVEYHEFERVLNKRGGGLRDIMENVFKVMDKDGDGKLSYDDLKSYMIFAGLPATDDDIKAMIILGGGDDNNGGVTFDGMIRILAIDY